MLCFLRVGLLALWVLFAMAGCASTTIQSDADAARPDDGVAPAVPSLQLIFVPPDALELRPSAAVAIRVEVVDPNGAPVPNITLRFSLVGDSADATLSDTRASTTLSPDGRTAGAQVTLHASTVSSDFSLRVVGPDGSSAQRTVSVSDQGFGSLVASFTYEGVRGATNFEVSLFGEARCEALANSRPSRTMQVMGASRVSARFDSLAAGRTFAVLADAFGASGERVATGCVESVTVAPNSTREIPLQLRDFPLRSEGRYAVELQLGLDVIATQAALLWRESTRVESDEAGALLAAMSGAVFRVSGAEAKAQFDSAIEASLRRDVELALRSRDSLPSSLIARWSQAIASSVGGARWRGDIVATIRGGRTVFTVERVQITVDPQTPDLLDDDITRDLMPSGAGAIDALAGDRMSVLLDRVAMPVSAIAVAARDAQLTRVRADSTAQRLRASIRCDLLDGIVRPFAAGCDEACIVEACEGVLQRWGSNFDLALRSATASLQSAQASFIGVARAPAGSVTVSRIASGAVDGLFVEDPSRPVRGVATVMRP
jgi:hypothetical protein